jgi:hypothetical protein
LQQLERWGRSVWPVQRIDLRWKHGGIRGIGVWNWLDDVQRLVVRGRGLHRLVLGERLRQQRRVGVRLVLGQLHRFVLGQRRRIDVWQHLGRLRRLVVGQGQRIDVWQHLG